MKELKIFGDKLDRLQQNILDYVKLPELNWPDIKTKMAIIVSDFHTMESNILMIPENNMLEPQILGAPATIPEMMTNVHFRTKLPPEIEDEQDILIELATNGAIKNIVDLKNLDLPDLKSLAIELKATIEKQDSIFFALDDSYFS